MTTKPFPVAVSTESSQPITLNQFSISRELSRKRNFNEHEAGNEKPWSYFSEEMVSDVF